MSVPRTAATIAGKNFGLALTRESTLGSVDGFEEGSEVDAR